MGTKEFSAKRSKTADALKKEEAWIYRLKMAQTSENPSVGSANLQIHLTCLAFMRIR